MPDITACVPCSVRAGEIVERADDAEHGAEQADERRVVAERAEEREPLLVALALLLDDRGAMLVDGVRAVARALEARAHDDGLHRARAREQLRAPRPGPSSRSAVERLRELRPRACAPG